MYCHTIYPQLRFELIATQYQLSFQQSYLYHTYISHISHLSSVSDKAHLAFS